MKSKKGFDLRKYPDVLVDEKVVKSPKKLVCEHCKGLYENKDKNQKYSYSFKCPYCGNDHNYESAIPMVQLLVVCPCQTEFNIYCLKNKIQSEHNGVKNDQV